MQGWGVNGLGMRLRVQGWGLKFMDSVKGLRMGVQGSRMG